MDRWVRGDSARDVAHFLTFGAAGLLLEWTLMGLAPWSDPKANPLAMLLFQLGMFAFWGTVATAPRVFLDNREFSRRARRDVLRFAIPYGILTYAIGLSVPPRLRFPVIIPLVILGYLVIATLLLWRPLCELVWSLTVRRRSRGSIIG